MYTVFVKPPVGCVDVCIAENALLTVSLSWCALDDEPDPEPEPVSGLGSPAVGLSSCMSSLSWPFMLYCFY